MLKVYKIDKYNVKNYKLWFKLSIAFLVLYTYITLMAIPLYYVEESVGNIKTYGDAFWVLQMSASTIGFGDYYPVTVLGRWIVAFSFYIGVGLAGYAGSSIASTFTNFTETNVQNRELQRQNAEILQLLKNKKEINE
jgi:voltage-gated potassium channel